MQRVTRIKREIEQLQQMSPCSAETGVHCWITDSKLDSIQASIFGQKDTFYEGGVFNLTITVPKRYPFEPPQVRFSTPIYHPNIDLAGRVCLDILKMPPKGAWKPIHNISTVLKSIQILMAFPNPEDPLMADIAAEFKNDIVTFTKNAKRWTTKYATDTNIAKASENHENSTIEAGHHQFGRNNKNQTVEIEIDHGIPRPSKKTKLE